MFDAVLLVNFGGPRHVAEVESFLQTLLTDQEVIRTPFPKWLHHLIFSRVARKRAPVVSHDYQKIGGRSPIFEDTEAIAKFLFSELNVPVHTFHRYLPETHGEFIEKIERCAAKEICVFPLFPQFSYATVGSIAKWFQENLSREIVHKLRWIKSYAGHPRFIACSQEILREFLQKNALREEETLLFFSPHGLPKQFILTGDIYESECRLSFEKITEPFAQAKKLLAYQSQFGKGEWLRPYTKEVCEEILTHHQNCKNVVFFPLSFTSDHIETLFEVEYTYLPLVREKQLNAYRCPALNRRLDWLKAICKMIEEETNFSNNQMLIRQRGYR